MTFAYLEGDNLRQTRVKNRLVCIVSYSSYVPFFYLCERLKCILILLIMVRHSLDDGKQKGNISTELMFSKETLHRVFDTVDVHER